MRFYNNYSFSIYLSLLLIHIFISKDLTVSSSCQTECGNIKIPYPFGIKTGCYLDNWYEIECRNATFPFLVKMGMEVVDISIPGDRDEFYYKDTLFGAIRIKSPITSVGCSRDGIAQSSGSVLNMTDSPFFFGKGNRLVAVGCNSKASLTHMEPIKVACELNCNASKETSKTIPFFNQTGCSDTMLSYAYKPVCTKTKRKGDTSCDGNGCCQSSLPDDFEARQVIGVSLESFNNENSTKQECRVAFLTDEVYTLSNATKPQRLFAKGYAIIKIGWLVQTKNLSFLNSLSCQNKDEFNILTYDSQYSISNPYLLNGCEDFNECDQMNNPDIYLRRRYCGVGDTCVNLIGHHKCVQDKTGAIMIGVGAGFGVLVLVAGIWLLRKFYKKRRITQRKKKFFKRNGGLLLQQQLKTRDGNVEKTRIFSSRELEKATANFGEDRILGQGGQGTVYKGMLVDGRTVAVKKSKVVDEDKLEEFINELVILSQINHRHVVKLFGCCLETEVPVLVYEFISNGNLFQHIHEESDDYTMIWGVRLRIAVDMAGALSYLHSAALTVDHTHWTTVISVTVGYVDPEYYGSSQYTDKSDVYSFGVILVELITGEKPVITLPDSQEIRGLADHFRAAMKKNKLIDIMDAPMRDACKPEQVKAVANLARRCLNSKGKKRPYMREVFTELEKICSSPEDSLVKIENDDGDGDEEEGMDMIVIADSWTVGVTAPVASASSSDVKPLLPPPTW
ncbi:hypothetical protein DY000_02045853 [Brassica cretica]|uniref:Protein kinase domain-containing protein n=1 Tax=Brassica cretica TaxID=69181 RepID=A0ABQ7F806_BRACR|nr:hypothetical protein DY000_02045853 [Brassica cretica]